MPQSQLDAGLIFSGKPSGTMISGYDEPSTYTPAINHNYIFHDSSRDIIVWFLMENPDPLYLCGPTSAGKSSLIRQIAARLNYPVFEATGHDRLEFPDLVGHLSVQNGNMEFQDGPLTMAMKTGGIFLFNEADLCSPSTLAGLNPSLTARRSVSLKMVVNWSIRTRCSDLWSQPIPTVQVMKQGCTKV